MRTEKAIKARLEGGKEIAQELFDYLKENPDKTTYELHKALGWSTGKVQGALKRIDDRVQVKEEVKGGRLKKKYRALMKDTKSEKTKRFICPK